MNIVKKVGTGGFYFLAFGVSIYALLFVAVDSIGSQYLKEKFALTPLAMYLHIIGGSIALAVGIFQLNSRIRAKRLGLHRALGRIYAVAVLLSGFAGLYLATNSMGGPVAHVGFGALAVLWIFTLCMAVFQIRKGNINSHRYWMITNYSLTCAAITLRLYLPTFPLIFNTDFMTSYTAISWACWVPNLLLSQWYLAKNRNIGTAIFRTANGD